MTRAMVPVIMPRTEMPEMILMAFWDFLPRRYRLAIYRGRFTSYTSRLVLSPYDGFL